DYYCFSTDSSANHDVF
nr:immunoglobulin light chain junction region [Macaca mulatta]MOX83828.1 immunoglobulin light chain junction region [Macaca mulatta]